MRKRWYLAGLVTGATLATFVVLGGEAAYARRLWNGLGK